MNHVSKNSLQTRKETTELMKGVDGETWMEWFPRGCSQAYWSVDRLHMTLTSEAGDYVVTCEADVLTWKYITEPHIKISTRKSTPTMPCHTRYVDSDDSIQEASIYTPRVMVLDLTLCFVVAHKAHLSQISKFQQRRQVWKFGIVASFNRD